MAHSSVVQMAEWSAETTAEHLVAKTAAWKVLRWAVTKAVLRVAEMAALMAV